MEMNKSLLDIMEQRLVEFTFNLQSLLFEQLITAQPSKCS